MDDKDEEMRPGKRHKVALMETSAADSEEELTDEQQERQIREDCARNIDIMLQHETMIGLNQIPRRYVLLEDVQAITVAWETEANHAIAELRMAARPCYMQQERKEANACQDTKATGVFRHRYGLVAPNSLGPYTPVYTNRNRKGVNKLFVHLNQALWKQNEEGMGATGYKCRYCSRRLYVSIAQLGETIYCACWRCISVMYCSPLCRDHDQEEHQMSCFLHPAWECKEAEGQPSGEAEDASTSERGAASPPKPTQRERGCVTRECRSGTRSLG